MGKPYSEDLRKRVVAAVETGGLSCNQAAKQFGVAISTAIVMGAPATRDRQRGAGQDGRSPAEGDFRRTPCLAVTEDQARLHFARSGRRTCRARAEGRLPFGVGVRPCREAQLQKKAWWLANAIVPTSPGDEPSGSNIKIASNLSVWSSSTRPGPGPIWRHCGDGRHAAAGSPPRFHTAAGRP